MPRYRTALGIDISDSRINLALLKKHGDSVKLLKAAGCPVPEGAIKDGNIENAAALAKAIRKLKARNGIRVHPTAISLMANPTLMQILDLPKDAPGNVRQFVHNEVKHYAMLPIKKAAVDFCGIKSSSRSGNRRALVVATDGQKVATAMKVLNRQGLNIEAIEPMWTAYIKACYAKTIAGTTNTTQLYAMVFDGILTLALFKQKTLDFIRVKPVETEPLQAEEYFEWLEQEINEVLKFYKFGITKKSDKWQVIIVTNIYSEIVEEKAEQLRTRFGSIELQVRTPENAHLDTPVVDEADDNKPSAVAIGLAMGLLNISGPGLNINLLPSQVAIAKSKEKQTLLIANIAAVTFAIMIICIGFLQAKTRKVNKDINQQKQMQVTCDTQELLKEQSVLQKQITEIQSKLELMNNALASDAVLTWGQILNDIRIATPERIRITEIFSSENSNILLSGQALSYETLYLFIEALSACKNIESASLIVSQNNNRQDGLIGYSINCLLTQ